MTRTVWCQNVGWSLETKYTISLISDLRKLNILMQVSEEPLENGIGNKQVPEITILIACGNFAVFNHFGNINVTLQIEIKIFCFNPGSGIPSYTLMRV